MAKHLTDSYFKYCNLNVFEHVRFEHNESCFYHITISTAPQQCTLDLAAAIMVCSIVLACNLNCYQFNLARITGHFYYAFKLYNYENNIFSVLQHCFLLFKWSFFCCFIHLACLWWNVKFWYGVVSSPQVCFKYLTFSHLAPRVHLNVLRAL